MAQKDRKNRSKRGTRSCGYGNAQKHRGAGSRGGRGKASLAGSKKVSLNIKNPRYFGKSGFKRPQKLVEVSIPINVGEINKRIDAWVKDGKAKKKGQTYFLELEEVGYTKVLGGGKLDKQVEITSHSFSKSAAEKIEKQEGKAILKE